ncbi:MAG: prepilin-type N-terminal cleavage/methylation domain-containing protein [Candidatus Omnitrophica bacterium]|nr:prepilin-type N-terminal cleavage/methylation domain-containing protein [Candidatus Omnitrophota bacterium]
MPEIARSRQRAHNGKTDKRKRTHMKKKGLTFLELIVVVVIIGIISAFAIPNYQKALNKAHERDVMLQLTSLYAACQIYKAETGHYYTGMLVSADAINNTFHMNIIPNGFGYAYKSTTGNNFGIYAWGYGFEVGVESVRQMGDNNPCCVHREGFNDCPTLQQVCTMVN